MMFYKRFLTKLIIASCIIGFILILIYSQSNLFLYFKFGEYINNKRIQAGIPALKKPFEKIMVDEVFSFKIFEWQMNANEPYRITKKVLVDSKSEIILDETTIILQKDSFERYTLIISYNFIQDKKECLLIKYRSLNENEDWAANLINKDRKKIENISQTIKTFETNNKEIENIIVKSLMRENEAYFFEKKEYGKELNSKELDSILKKWQLTHLYLP